MYLPTCYLYSFYYTSADFGGKAYSLVSGGHEVKRNCPMTYKGSLRTAKGPCNSKPKSTDGSQVIRGECTLSLDGSFF